MPITKIKEERIKNNKFRDYLMLTLTILIVLALGLFIFNQLVQFRFNMLTINSPCDLCLELNPTAKLCTNYTNLDLVSQSNNLTDLVNLTDLKIMLL